MPISRVRRATVNDISEWMPVADSSSTMNEISQATEVSAQFLFASPPPACASGCTSVSRIVGSTSAATVRRRVANASGSRTRTASCRPRVRRGQARPIHRRLLLRPGQLPAEVLDHADDLVPLLAGIPVDLTAHDADALTDRVAARRTRGARTIGSRSSRGRSRSRAARSRGRRPPTCRRRRRSRETPERACSCACRSRARRSSYRPRSDT